MGKINVVFLFLMVIGSEVIYSQINAGFENGLSGWIPIGKKKNISIDHIHAFEGKSCIRIGPGKAGLEQRMKTLPLSIVQYTFQIKLVRFLPYIINQPVIILNLLQEQVIAPSVYIRIH